MRPTIIKTNTKNFTQLSNNFSHALLCIGAFFMSSEVGAATVNCSSDLVAGFIVIGGNPSRSAYGSCTVGGNPAFLVKIGAATIVATNNTGGGSFSSPLPTPARSLGTTLSTFLSDMGTTEPTLPDCVGATYSGSSLAGTSGNWYCAKFVSSPDTGYMAAKWDGSAFVVSILPSPPPAAVSAPIDFFNHQPIKTFAHEMELK